MKNKDLKQQFTVTAGVCIPFTGVTAGFFWKRMTALLGLLTFLSVNGWGQLTFTSAALTQTQNFNGMNAADLPAGFTITSKDLVAGGSARVLEAVSVNGSATSLNGSSTGQSYKFSSGTDHAIGFLASGSFTPGYITAALVNNTGAAITKLTISFDYEKYRSGSRVWNWTFTGGETIAATTAIPGGNHSYDADPANTTASFPPLVVAKTGIEVTVNIPAGGSYYLKWTLVGVGGVSNGQALAVDNISVTATVAAPSCSVTAPGTVTSVAGNSFCGTGSTTLSLTGTTPSTGISYQWKSSADSINWTNAGTSATLAVTPAVTTFYKCVVKCITGASEDSTPGYKITVNPLPAATISGSAGVCNGGGATVTFNGTPDATVTYTAGTITRTILLDGTGTASINPVSIVSDTTYSIVSVAKGSCSQTVTGQQAILQVTALPVASVSGGTNVCSGAPATITFTGTPNATVTYTAGTLSRTIVLNGSGSAAITRSFTSDTTYTIVSVSGGTCSQNITGQQAVVHVNALPVASVSGSTSVCSGASATVTFTGTPNATVTYTAGTLSRTIALNGSGSAVITRSFTSDTTYTIMSVTDGTCSQNITGQQAVVHVNALLVASVSGGTNVCSGASATVTFTGTPNATVTYTAGTLSRTVVLNGSGSATITRSFTSDTTYTVMSVTDGTCSQNITGQQAVIHVNALPVASVSGGTSVCSGASATITFNGTPNATVTYTAGILSRTVVLNGSGSAAITRSFTSSDTVYAVVSVTNGTCSQNITGQQATIQVLPPPVVAISDDTALCLGASTAIIFTGTPNATVDYNAGMSGRTLALDGSGVAVLNRVFTADTTYTIVSVTEGSCTQPVTGEQAVVQVYPLPLTTVQVGGATLICEGDSVALTAPAGTGYSYQWRQDAADAVQSQVFHVKNTGDYKVIVTDAHNCTDSSTPVSVTAYTIPAVSITQGDTAFCDGGVVRLQVTTADTGLDFRWKNGNADVANATAYFLEINSTGVYSVIAERTVVAHCAVTSDPVTITVYPVMQPEIRWDGLAFHTEPYFTGYQWFEGGLPVDNATDSTFIPSEDGAYTVVATDSNGCTSTSHTYNVHVPSAQIGDAAVAGGRIQIYPNPTSGVLHIVSPEPVHIILGSMDGKQVLEQKQVRSIDMGQLTDGVYYLRITDHNGALIRTERIVKRSL